MSGLQKLSELHTLALDGNILNSAEVRPLVCCHTIITRRQITKRLFSQGLLGLRSLKVLNFAFNQLTSLSSLGRLTSLEMLNVAGNQIADLEGLSACPNLRVLNACSNRLTHLKGLARCANLQELHVADNKLADLSGLKMVASNLEVRMAREAPGLGLRLAGAVRSAVAAATVSGFAQPSQPFLPTPLPDADSTSHHFSAIHI